MKEVISITLAGVAVFYAALYGVYHHYCPFGARPCWMLCTSQALRLYANDHDG